MSRQDEFLCTVTVDGEKIGVFDKHDGGASTAADTKYRPGGLGAEVSRGGPKSVDNVTVSREYDPPRDHDLVHRLLPKAGWARGTVSLQPVDRNKVPFGDPFVRTATLLKVTPPNYDSTASGIAMVELEFSCDGEIA